MWQADFNAKVHRNFKSQLIINNYLFYEINSNNGNLGCQNYTVPRVGQLS